MSRNPNLQITFYVSPNERKVTWPTTRAEAIATANSLIEQSDVLSVLVYDWHKVEPLIYQRDKRPQFDMEVQS